MKIVSKGFESFHHLRFLNAARGGGVESERLPFLRGRAEGIPEDLDAIILTSDLQGVVPVWSRGGETVLLGLQLVEELADLADTGSIPDLSRIGVILAGDLYAAPGGDKRGASGDVREVWQTFSDFFPWVAGVAGNHDRFGSEREQARLCQRKNLHLLDGEISTLSGIAIGGVSYIMGDPAKAGRADEQEFIAALDLVLGEEPDLLVLHQGPCGDRSQRGDLQVRARIEKGKTPLTVCGHVHWDEPMAMVGDHQVINVDSRVVLLTR